MVTRVIGVREVWELLLLVFGVWSSLIWVSVSLLIKMLCRSRGRSLDIAVGGRRRGRESSARSGFGE